MANRYQKVLLVVIIGGCIGGIAFQHYERGPKMRLARIEEAVRKSDWDGLVKGFSESTWNSSSWSPETTSAFLKHYVEPIAGDKVESKQTKDRWFGYVSRKVTRFDKMGKKPVLEVFQHQDEYVLWTTRTSRYTIPIGWSDVTLHPILLIRAIAPIRYPHREISSQSLAERVSEYEFYVAERANLTKIGGNKLSRDTTLGVGPFADNYRANLKSLFSQLSKEFDKVDAKYAVR